MHSKFLMVMAIGVALAVLQGCRRDAVAQSSLSEAERGAVEKNTNLQVVREADGRERIVAQIGDFPKVASRRQQTPVWCWATCAEMIHKHYGREQETQELIAEKIFQRADDLKRTAAGDPEGGTPRSLERSAGEWAISRALLFDLHEKWNQQMKDRFDASQGKNPQQQMKIDGGGIIFGEIEKAMASDGDVLIDSLNMVPAHPSVLLLPGAPNSANMGHAVVAYGAKYSLSQEGETNFFERLVTRKPEKYKIHEVWYIDPWDGQSKSLVVNDDQRLSDVVDKVINRPEAERIAKQQFGTMFGERGSN